MSVFIKRDLLMGGLLKFMLWIVLLLPTQSFGQLNGSYTIGATGDYTSFGAAITAMEASGISGDVVFNIQTGNYKEQLALVGVNIAGSSSHAISFIGQGAKEDVVLYYDVNSEDFDYTLSIDGANDLVFRSMTLQNSSSGNYASVVTVGNSATVSGITFDNCYFLGQTGLGFSSFPTLLFFSSGGAHDIMVKDCVFRNAYYGLSSFGTSEVTVENNEFYNQNIQSLSLSVSHALVQGNYVENDVSAVAYSIGLELWSSSDFVVNRNTLKLSNGAKGMQFQSSSVSDSTVNIASNNYLQLSNTTNSIVGVTFDLATKLDFVHNSINMSSLLSVAAFTGGSEVSLYNNILMNYGDGSVYSAILNLFHDADYNVVYSEGILSTLGATLNAHQSNSGLDQNSVNFNLEFPQDGLPNICHYSVSNTGKELVHSVAKDYNGVDRNTTTPDIGAYEFDLPTTAIFTPDTLALCLGDTLSVSAESTFVSYLWLNDSSTLSARDAFEEDKFFLQVVDGDACTLLDSLAIEVQSVAIDLGEDQVICSGSTITLEAEPGFHTYAWSTGDNTSSLDITTEGTYTLEVSNELGCTDTDEIIITLSDDFIVPNFLVSGVGCTSDTVQFVEVSDIEPDGVLWDFGDGNTSDEQHPAHLFGAVGDYSVNMTATLGECSKDVSKEVVITSTCADFLIAYYPLDTAANDIGDNMFDGTSSGDLVFVEDSERGLVAAFDGMDDYIQLLAADALDLTNSNFTVSAWVKTENQSDDLPILGTNREENGKGLNLGIVDGKATLDFFNEDLTGIQSLTAGDWHFINYIYDFDAKQMAIYVDGELDATVSDKEPFTGSDIINMGWANSTNYFEGYIDDLSIWKEALTAEEVYENWSGYATELLAYYPLTENATDASGNEFHGTINGDVAFENDSERGMVASFGGTSSDYILLHGAEEQGITESSFIVSAWVKVSAFDKADLSILGTTQTQGQRQGLHLITRNRNPHMGFWAMDTRDESTTLMVNEWYHVSYLYDKEAGVQKIYINGQNTAIGQDKLSFLGEDDLVIGNSIGFSKGFNGSIHDLKIRKIKSQSGAERIESEVVDERFDREMKLYPNPSGGWVNITLTNREEFEGALEVFDLHGNLIQGQFISSSNDDLHETLDLQDLNRGLYLIKISTRDDQYIKRLILH